MILGVDIASVDANKAIDWTAARAAGVQFAIFRGSYGAFIDLTFRREAQRARDAGLVVGGYLFPLMRKGSPDVRTQVGAFASALATRVPGDLPPTLDVEFPGGIAATGRSRAELLQWIRDAIQQLRQTFRVWPMVYTSARVWDGTDDDSLDAASVGYPQCPLWLARYPFKIRTQAVLTGVDALPTPPVPKGWGDAGNVWIHQYQGDSLGMPGFSATCDLNRFFALRSGATGERVKWVQAHLRIAQTGQFDAATAASVKTFQRDNTLTQDGVVGPRTFARMATLAIP